MREERPWGYFENLVSECDVLKIKLLVVCPNQRLSMQSHKYRNEQWIVVQGEASVQLMDSEFVLLPEQSFHILRGMKHRLSNLGNEPLVIIEVQTGPYLGEDDIERFEDDYGRVDA